MNQRALSLAAMLLLLAGCARPRPDRLGPAANRVAVPFVAQQPNRCGPAALAMVAGYYGKPMRQQDMPVGSHGALTIDLVEQARRLGLWARQYRGSQTDLRAKLGAGVPLIVRGRFGASEHFLVVHHWDGHRQVVTVHTDARPDLELTLEEFDRFWDRGDRWSLLVCPPARATWDLSAEEHNDLAVHWERAGQLGAAAGHYREAADQAPANAYYPMNLGNALAKQQLLAEAARAYAQAVQRDPANPDALNNLAWAYGELGANLDQAVALAQRAVELAGNRRAYYLDTLGTIYLRQGRPKEAAAAFEQALAATTERQAALRKAIQQRLAQLPR